MASRVSPQDAGMDVAQLPCGLDQLNVGLLYLRAGNGERAGGFWDRRLEKLLP